MSENIMNSFPEGKIVLLNGRVLDCHPRADLSPDNLMTTDEHAQRSIAKKTTQTYKETEADKKRFIKNAFFFLAHKERILADSRMFLCPVPIQSGMSISGTSGFENPTLGIYLQWWEKCEAAIRTDKKGRHSLLYKLSGSSISGHNICSEVYEDGSTKDVEMHPFKDYRDTFISINNLYKSAKQRYQAYSLQQVLDILDHEEEGDSSYAYIINEQLQSHEISVLNQRVKHMKTTNEGLENRLKELEKALYDEWVLHYYDGYLALHQRVLAETEQLNQQKRDLKAALRRGDYTSQHYERLVNAINKRINEVENELAEYKESELLKAFPEQAMPFWYIEDYAKKLREKDLISSMH